MNDLRTAVQQALEALDAGVPISPKSILHDWFRAALTQQAEPVAPVAWDVTKNGRLIYDYDFTHDVSLRVMGDFEDDEQRVRYVKQIVDKLNAAPAQQAEPDHEIRAELAEQQVVQLAEERDHYRNLWQKAQQAEPVAWRSENANPPGGYVIFQQYPQALADLGKPIQPLYTAPPQRKLVPLTEEEIWALYFLLPLDDFEQSDRVDFARAIEKASWEKNNGQA